jgi:GTP-binding protein HflX
VILQLRDPKADAQVQTSIKYGNGLDQLLAALEKMMQADKLLIERVFDYKHAGEIAVIRKYGQLLEERYQEDGIYVKAFVPKDIYAQLSF